MTTSRTGAPRSNGFTYLELIIVMTVMAVITAMVWPQFSGTFAGLAFEQAHTSLASSLRYAQSRAVAQRQLVQLTLVHDGASRGYQLRVLRADQPAEGQALPGRFGRLHALPQDTSLDVMLPDGRERVPPAVTFYPDGTADPAQFVVKRAGRSPVTVNVDAATGQIAITTTTANAH